VETVALPSFAVPLSSAFKVQKAPTMTTIKTVHSMASSNIADETSFSNISPRMLLA
jgi:hypothetical protein